MPQLSESSRRYLEPLLSNLTQHPRPGQAVEIILPGGDVYKFNGRYNPLKEAPREIEVLPGRGSRNRIEVEPPSPITTRPQETPMPAKKKLRIGKVYSPAIGTELEGILMQIDSGTAAAGQILEYERGKIQSWHDACCLEQTLPQTQPQLNKIRTRLGDDTTVKTRTHEGKRIRIHGWSRVAI